MIGGYAAAMLPTLVDPALAQFELFLALPDPDLQKWVLNGEPVEPAAFAPLVADVRTFHGL